MRDFKVALEEACSTGRPLLCDGAMGSVLSAAGHDMSRVSQLLLEHPDAIEDVHRAYVAAGAQVVLTHTFGAAGPAAAAGGFGVPVSDYVGKAVCVARASGAPYVALDLGPTGELLDPYGDLEEDEAEELFATVVEAGASGCDLVLVETMAAVEEAACAIRAAKRCCALPVAASMSFNQDGFTYMGVTVEVGMAAMEEAGADIVGINCSVGPFELADVVSRARACTDLPLIVQPNAGLPAVVDGKTCYPLDPEEYVRGFEPLLASGIAIAGGCCGTTPEHIAALKRLLDRI